MNVKYDCYITTPTQEREKKSVNIKYLMIATRKKCNKIYDLQTSKEKIE